MNFETYQVEAGATATYADKHSNIVYPALGLVGEAGEFAEKVKKNWRNNGSMNAHNLTEDQRKEFMKELGDVLWYIAACANELSVSLEDIAQLNIDKLKDRRLRGVIKGEGDNR